MIKVEIPKTEYEQLKKQAEAYRRFTAKFFESIIQDPVDQVVKDFRKTNLYTEEFLKDLGTGLRRSSYLKLRRHGNKTSKKKS